MMSCQKTKIDFQLSGELPEKLDAYIDRGVYSDKPELVRDALRHLFEHLEETDFLFVRHRMMQRV